MTPLDGDIAYSVEDADITHGGDDAIAVWRASLGNQDSRAAKFDWFYRDAPDGALLQVLRHGPGQAAVGTAGVGWRRMRVGAHVLRAGLLADMAVLTNHRMLGPALLLQRSACERALADGDLVYGFPNPNAVPVVKRLGYVHLGDMTLHVRIVRHADYLARKVPRWLAMPMGAVVDLMSRLRNWFRLLPGRKLQATWLDTAPPQLGPNAPCNGNLIQGLRERSTLEWRFTQCPMAPFRFLSIQHENETSILAWFACHRDGKVLRIADYVISDGIPASQCHAILAETAYEMGCRSIAIDCCLPDDELSMLHANGFHARQKRPIYAKWKNPAMAATGARFTAYDEDE